jgi:Mg2+ and Co2+ transporter CorA
MKRMTNISRSLVVLVPLLYLVIAYGLRFRRLPEWSRNAYPFVLWPLFTIVVILSILFIIDSLVRRYRR